MTSVRTPQSAATASHRRPALVVTGEAVPLPHSAATCAQRSGSTPASGAGSPPSISVSHAHAIRHGSRIARSPPGRRTGHRWAARSKPASPPASSSPPHTVPSVP